MSEVMKTSVADDVSQMHQYYGFDRHEFDLQMLRHRMIFLIEEHKELQEAYNKNDPEKFIDAIIDLIVVSVGTLDLACVDFEYSWKQVHFANMSKEVGLNPNRPNSGGIDLIKPHGWVAPLHEGNYGKLLNAFQEKEKEEVDLLSKKRLEEERLIDNNSRYSVRVLKEISQNIHKFSLSFSDDPLKSCSSWIDEYLERVRDKLKLAHTSSRGDILYESAVRDSIILTKDLIVLCVIGASNYLNVGHEEIIHKVCLLQSKKAQDYQNSNSTITQATYYSWSGIWDNVYMIYVKCCRLKSLVESAAEEMFESKVDTLLDVINYASFVVSWLNYRMEGQDEKLDIFLR